jgi:hypothetical protein
VHVGVQRIAEYLPVVQSVGTEGVQEELVLEGAPRRGERRVVVLHLGEGGYAGDAGEAVGEEGCVQCVHGRPSEGRTPEGAEDPVERQPTALGVRDPAVGPAVLADVALRDVDEKVSGGQATGPRGVVRPEPAP